MSDVNKEIIVQYLMHNKQCLKGADLRGLDLSCVYLREADLRHAKIETEEQTKAIANRRKEYQDHINKAVIGND